MSNTTVVLVWTSTEPQEPADYVPAVYGAFCSWDEAFSAMVADHNSTCDEGEELTEAGAADAPRLGEASWDFGYGLWTIAEV